MVLLAKSARAAYNIGVDTCPECGNSDLQACVMDGAAYVVCGLCGERFGQRHVLESVSDREEAVHQGYEVAVWPLVRALLPLQGLAIEAAEAGDVERDSGPSVTLSPRAQHGLQELENLGRSLRLAAGSLHLEWVIEVDCERRLAFVLRARVRAAWSAAALRQAHLDIETLARDLERNRKLQWWQQAPARR